MASPILIVDDNADMCRTLSRLLRHMGFSTECAFSGEEALSQIKQSKPALILLDYMMPNMDGLEVLREVKSDQQTAEIPVVMLTAVSDPDTAQAAMGKGAAAYWVKGNIDYDRLRTDLTKFLSIPDA